ncbi:hypothetical protein BST81_11735 [Leptolyngbya sp. 'hensonii']|nr:hypothetical protein BST81_11735 [Leptolyngbya sp. 'hensonii']
MPDGVVLELVRGAHGLQRAEPDTMQETGTIQLALQLMGEAVIVTDAAGRVIFLNSDAEKLTGWKFEDAQSQLASTVFQVVQDINVNLVEPFTESSLEELHHGEQTNTEYVLLLSKDNRQLVIDYSVTLLRGSDGAVEGTLLVFRNINGTSSSARSRTWQTNYDPLTQLMNRCFFEQYLERVVCNSRILDQQHVLCYIDVDRFKIINEVGGHIAGDEFLCQISQLFRQRVRKTDILARLGSDEFALILHQCELEQALKVVQSLCEEVQKLRFFWKNNTFNLTISVGLVLLNNHYDSLSSALSAADAACQTAKSHGRNRIHVYQPETDGLHRRTEMHWAMRLFNALETDQFRL